MGLVVVKPWKYPKCRVEWDGEPVQVLVYNREFRERVMAEQIQVGNVLVKDAVGQLGYNPMVRMRGAQVMLAMPNSDMKKLEAEDLLIPPLCSCIYSSSNSLKGFLYSLELETDRTLPRKQAIFKKRLPQPTADNPFGERVAKHITVPKEKLEVIENIIAEYRMRKWKDLPNRESIEGNTDFISIVFNYSDGNNACLNSDHDLPPEYQDAFGTMHLALAETDKFTSRLVSGMVL